MRTFRINGIGTLSPQVQTGLEDRLAAAEDFQVQIINDLRVLADQGVDVSSYKAELDQGMDATKGLYAQIQSAADDSTQGSISAQIDTVNARLKNLLQRTGAARQGTGEGSQLRGLGWGLGVVAVAATIAGAVWLGSRRRRRR